jgi:hypothetical protein
MLLKDFIYSNYSVSYFALLIKEYNNKRIVLSRDFFYDMSNRLRRDIHTKYFYKYFYFSEHLTDTCFRYFDYDPDYDDYLYDANSYLQLHNKNTKYSIDDLHDLYIKNKKEDKDILIYSKDDIFYYKYQKLYEKILAQNIKTTI